MLFIGLDTDSETWELTLAALVHSFQYTDLVPGVPVWGLAGFKEKGREMKGDHAQIESLDARFSVPQDTSTGEIMVDDEETTTMTGPVGQGVYLEEAGKRIRKSRVKLTKMDFKFLT